MKFAEFNIDTCYRYRYLYATHLAPVTQMFRIRLGQKSIFGRRESTLHLRMILLILCLSGFSLTSCSPPESKPGDRATAPATLPSSAALPASPTPTTTPFPDPAPTASKLPQQKSAATASTIVNLYKVDNQCLDLVPIQTNVAAEQPIAAIVGKILQARDSADFSVAGYRVRVADGVATIELRLAANAKRSFSSLSACEQLALFGSIRKTLMSHAQWQIQTLQFTQQGREIVF
jgi:hypothetical protein